MISAPRTPSCAQSLHNGSCLLTVFPCRCYDGCRACRQEQWARAQGAPCHSHRLLCNAHCDLRAAQFMAQSWIVSLYVDCPPGAGLMCPDEAALAQFNDSVAKGE